jgi:hypothetical protein
MHYFIQVISHMFIITAGRRAKHAVFLDRFAVDIEFIETRRTEIELGSGRHLLQTKNTPIPVGTTLVLRGLVNPFG